MIGGLDHDVTAAWWPALPQAAVPEDPRDDRRLLDDGDEPQLAATPRTDQHVFPPPPAEERGPGETAGAPGISGTIAGVGATRVPVLVVRLRIDSFLSIVVRDSDFSRFGDDPEQRYRGNKVTVTGQVRDYRGRLQSRVVDPGQITGGA